MDHCQALPRRRRAPRSSPFLRESAVGPGRRLPWKGSSSQVAPPPPSSDRQPPGGGGVGVRARSGRHRPAGSRPGAQALARRRQAGRGSACSRALPKGPCRISHRRDIRRRAQAGGKAIQRLLRGIIRTAARRGASADTRCDSRAESGIDRLGPPPCREDPRAPSRCRKRYGCLQQVHADFT